MGIMRPAFTRFYASKWRSATLMLTLEEEGLYIRFSAFQMECGRPVPHDWKEAARLLCVQPLKYRKNIDSLIARGLIVDLPDGLICERALMEFRRAARVVDGGQLPTGSPRVPVDDPNPPTYPATYPPTYLGTRGVEAKKEEQNQGQFRNRREEEKEREESPLSPPQTADAVRGGVPAVVPIPDDPRSPPRRPRTARPLASEAETTAALDLFNRAADHWGFHRCRVLEGKRRLRLRARLAEIGGVEAFRLALRQIGRHDFLMGRVKGHEDFRLDLDKLLQTDGKMGDVLAGLVDAASGGGEQTPREVVEGKAWGWWRGKEQGLRGLRDDQWQAAIRGNAFDKGWPWWRLGPPPGHAECLIPPHLITDDLKRFGEEAF